MLAKKACLRFFTKLDQTERFASTFVVQVLTGIDHDLLGPSSLTWWPDVTAELKGRTTTTSLYNSFCQLLKRDLLDSQRL